MYYFITQNLVDDSNDIEIAGHTEVTGQYRWIAGHKFNKPMPVETLELDSDYGSDLPDFFDTTVPVMSKTLIQGFLDIGVDNFDRYPVILKRTDRGEEINGYEAVNFIGSIDAVDLESSEYEEDSFGDPDFEIVVIDPSKVKGANAFRLSSGPGLLVVSEKVAEHLKALNLSSVTLLPTEDYDDL